MLLQAAALVQEPALAPEGDAEALPEAPFVQIDPRAPATPLVHASPHSGRLYPEALLSASALDASAIRRSEDAHVDELLYGAVQSGGPLLLARYARAYVDLNRAPYELDPAMFEDELPPFAQGHVVGRTARAAAGLGSIARVVGEGQEIYRRKLTFAEARERIEAVHTPYHKALERLLVGARARHGAALLIDWHSMPSGAAGPGRRAPDVVLGDRFGAACAPAAVRWLEREFEARGYIVARNTPYAGGWTTARYGQPARGFHAVQVELNRALYLDEATLEPLPGFAALRRDLDGVLAAIAAVDWPTLLR